MTDKKLVLTNAQCSRLDVKPGAILRIRGDAWRVVRREADPKRPFDDVSLVTLEPADDSV